MAIAQTAPALGHTSAASATAATQCCTARPRRAVASSQQTGKPDAVGPNARTLRPAAIRGAALPAQAAFGASLFFACPALPLCCDTIERKKSHDLAYRSLHTSHCRSIRIPAALADPSGFLQHFAPDSLLGSERVSPWAPARASVRSAGGDNLYASPTQHSQALPL